MAENRIDSVIDIASVEAEIIKVEKQLAEMATTIKTFPKAQVFYDASGLKDLSVANKELSVVLSQLKVKNLELTNSIKEQQLAEKQLSVQRKQSIADAEKKAAAEKELSRQQQAAGTERLRALRVQKKAEEDLAEAQQKRQETELGTYNIPQGSGQKGGAKLVSSNTPTSEAMFVPTTDSDRLALSLIEDQRQLAATKEAQKLLSKEFADGKISQAEYDAQLVKSIQVQNDLKVSISNTTKELSLAAKANASIPGTIEDLQTRNAVLSKQASQVNVVNASPEEVAQLKSLNDEIDKNNELIRVNKDLLAQQKINIGNYPQALGVTFKTLNTELEQVQGKLVQGNFGGKEFDQLTAKQAVLQNALSLSGKTFKSTASEATAYKEAAVQIGQVYGKDSSIFKQFAEGVKTGAANTKALANEVAGVATKGKGFVSFLSAAWSGIRKLAYAIPGLGISGVILLLLGPLQAAGEAIVRTVKKSMESMSTISEEAKKKLEELTKAANLINGEYIRSSTASILKLENLRTVITDTSKTEKERLAALRDYNKIADSNNRIDEKQINNLNLINDSISRQIDLIEKRALANAGEKIVTDAAVKLLLAQQKAEEKARKQQADEDAYNIETDEHKKTDQYFKTLEREGAIRAKIAKDADVKQAQAELDAAKQIAFKNQNINGYVGSPEEAATIKKGYEQRERLLDKYRKKTLKEAQDYLKELDEAELKQYKFMADDQNLSLTERLDFEKKYYDKSLQMAKQNVQDQIDAVNLEASIATKKAGEIKDVKKKADTLTEIEDYRVTAIKRISEEGNAATLKIDRDFYNENVQIATQAYDKINKIAEESAKFRQDQEKIAFQNQKDQIDIDKNNQLLALDKAFKSGQIKNLEEYNQRKDDIETAADIKQKQLDLKRIQDAERIIEAIYGVKNLNLIKQAKDLEVEIEEAGNRKILNDRKKLNDSLAELRDQLEQTFQDVIEGGFDARQQKNEAETKAIQDKSQKEIDAINASGLAEEEKTRRVTAIQKQADFQTQQIEKRQQQLDIARAKFERVMSIAKIVQNTAIAISKAIAESPLTFGMPWTAIDAALGAAQIASILAQPLPHFKEGTKNAPRGKAIVGEEGSELIVDRSGRMFVTPPQPTLIELAGGEQVFKHDITADFLKHHNLLSILQKAQTQKQPVKVDDDLARRTLRVLQNIERKQGVTIINNVPIESTAYYNRNIKN